MPQPLPEITLDDILLTRELSRRSPRSPNLLSENQALHKLARQLANESEMMLQSLVDMALDLCDAGTTGVSLLETTPDGEEIFRWNVLAGRLSQYVGGTTPRNFSPCGTCLERGAPQLFSHPEQYFTYFQEANISIVEGLVLPIIADNHAFGTIWIMSHSEQRHFDSEDVRVMTSLADFTAAALLVNQRQTRELLAANAALEAEIAERKQVEISLRESEALSHAIIENLPGGAAFVVDRDLSYLLAEGEALSAAGFKPEDLVGQTIFEVMPKELTARYEVLYRQALAGEPFEHEHNAHDRSYISRGTPLRLPNGEIYAALAISYDISDRKRAEAILRESEARQAFLLRLSDVLRFIADPVEIHQAVTQTAMNYFGADRCYYCEIEDDIAIIRRDAAREDLPSVAGVYPLSRFAIFKAVVDAGRPFIVHNVHTSDRLDEDLRQLCIQLQVISFVDVPVIKNGKPVGILCLVQSTPRDWTDLEVELATETADRTWAAVERARAEVALAKSEEQYRTLFTSIDEGFCTIEVLFDDAGEAVDYRFLEANPVFVRQTGLENALGKTVRELVPEHEKFWFETYGRIAKTGEPMRFEHAAVALNPPRFYDVYAFRIGGSDENRVAVIFNDISERKWAEERQVFLLKLSDALRPLADPLVVQEVACRVLGEYLGANRVLYSEMAEGPGSQTLIRVSDYTAGVPSRVGWHRLDDYGKFVTETWRAGRNLVWSSLDDLPNLQSDERAAYEAVEIEAIIGVPLVKEGRFEAFLAVHQATPRKWTAEEIALVEETAERTWAAVERARAEESLRQSEEKYRLLFNSINEGYALCELLYDDDERVIDWKILQVNPAFESLTGLRDVAGKNATQLNQPLNQNWLQTFGTVAQTGESTRFEHYIDSADYWFEILVSRIDEDKHHIVVVFNNITDRKQAQADQIRLIQEQAAREQERQRAVREAARSADLADLDRAKTAFFSNVSHEFRTPITLLLAPLQDALSDRTHPLTSSQRERLELAHRNAIRLLKLVNTLLDFSRIEAGRMEAVYEPTDLAMFTTELASVFRSAIERAGLRLVVDCPTLPQLVYVDRQMWEKIVLNLLSNAFKFTFTGEITVRLHSTEDQVILQIQDTGIGIPPEELPHLFERFYQVRGAKARTHEGSGIGLALVQELIRLHGGTVDVSSTVEQGTCFTVNIPLGTNHLPNDRIQAARTLVSTALGAAPYVEEAELWLPAEAGEDGEDGEDEEVKLSPSSPSPPSPPSARILLVDDNADMRDYLTRILSEHVQVEAVADGAAALAALQEQVPDLVLSDIMMPGLDGFELVKALRNEACTREVPIILLSARANEASVIEGLQAGADDYLIKPFSAQELITRVLAHLQMAHIRLEALHNEKTINQKKDKFLAEVSHELNTPLVAILGWTRLLRSSPPNPAMLSKSLETIERNATLQAKLIQDLLDISRITTGKVRLNLQPVELQSVIETAIATLLNPLETKEICLECILDPVSIIVQGDPDRLQQIILNLLTNAVKFTPQGGRIEVRLEIIRNIAQIVVSDSGCGISAEFLPYIFETFRQSESSKGGLGLGLAIAHHLVELHGGTIRAESLGIGQGATFTVNLPLNDVNL